MLLGLSVLSLLLAIAHAADADEPWMTLPPTPELPPTDLSGYVEVNGIKIWFALFSETKVNDGHTVIFLHGGLGNSNYFGLQIEEISKYRRVLSIDSRGHGRSYRDATPYSYELMASDVIGVMDSFGIAQADIVGWSDGAIIGLVIARDHPNRLHSLFSFAANSDPSGVLDVSQSPVFNDYINRCSVEYTVLSPTPNDFDNFLAQISDMWATQPNITRDEMAQMTSSSSQPLWTVDADHEEAINRTNLLFMADSNPQFGLVMLPRVSHFAFIQDPTHFTEVVKLWLGVDETATSPASFSTVSSLLFFFVIVGWVAFQ